ncbi:MAG: hypothetical protein AAGE80_03200 [Pseudomonadota bacterium]
MFVRMLVLSMTLLFMAQKGSQAQEAPSCPAPKPVTEDFASGPVSTRVQRVTVPAFEMLASARVVSAGGGEHTLDRFPNLEGEGLGPRNLCFPIGLHQISGPEIAPGWDEISGIEIGIAGVALRQTNYAASHPALSADLRARSQLIALPEREYLAYLRPNNTAPLDHRRVELHEIVAHAMEQGVGVCDAWLINTGYLVLVPVCES